MWDEPDADPAEAPVVARPAAANPVADRSNAPRAGDTTAEAAAPTAGDNSGQPGLRLVQELFPGRVLSREPLTADGPEDGLDVESAGNEYPEADEGSTEGPGEDA